MRIDEQMKIRKESITFNSANQQTPKMKNGEIKE
jgi:hypothetical protein